MFKKLYWPSSSLRDQIKLNNNSMNLNKEVNKSTDLINSEDIKRNNLKWSMVDNIKLSYKEPLIMNTDISSGPGIHWIVLYPVDKVCYIFDPLGENNFRPYDKMMIEKLNDYDLKIKFYPGRIQFKNSNLCGYFSIMIAKYLKKYEPDEPFKIINELFGLKPDNNDIKQLIKHFGVLKTNA